MKERIRRITLNQQQSVTDALKLLEQGALRVVLVTDPDENLLGTVTDGDIRRAILKNMPLDTPISQVMNSSPITVQVGTSHKVIKQIMEQADLLQIPVLQGKKLVDLMLFRDLFQQPVRHNAVVLMAGGFGKRLGRLTQSCPKPMLQLGEKPLLETILENFIAAGFYRFFISVHFMPHVIKAHFGDGSKWGVNIHYVEEVEPLGTAGALGLIPEIPNELPVIVMNCDLLTKLDLGNLLEFHNESRSDITLCVRKHEYQVPYGVIETQGEDLTGIVEKPVQSYFVNAGIYIVSQKVMAMVPDDTYLDMPDLISRCVGKDNAVKVFPIHEYWLDIGQFDDFRQAQDDFTTQFV